MSSRESKQSNADWGWLRDTDDISVTGASFISFQIFLKKHFFYSKQIGVLAIHLHKLIIDKPFILKEIPIDKFRICITAYALSRYSKSVRVYLKENYTRLDQTMQMIIRVKERKNFSN